MLPCLPKTPALSSCRQAFSSSVLAKARVGQNASAHPAALRHANRGYRGANHPRRLLSAPQGVVPFTAKQVPTLTSYATEQGMHERQQRPSTAHPTPRWAKVRCTEHPPAVCAASIPTTVSTGPSQSKPQLNAKSQQSHLHKEL